MSPGQWFGVAAVLAGLVAAVLGDVFGGQTAGAVIGGADVLALASVFIYSTRRAE